jgi:hypothetical protein
MIQIDQTKSIGLTYPLVKPLGPMSEGRCLYCPAGVAGSPSQQAA